MRLSDRAHCAGQAMPAPGQLLLPASSNGTLLTRCRKADSRERARGQDAGAREAASEA